MKIRLHKLGFILAVFTALLSMAITPQMAMANNGRGKATEHSHKSHGQSNGSNSKRHNDSRPPQHNHHFSDSMRAAAAQQDPFNTNPHSWSAKLGLSAPPPWLKPLVLKTGSRLNFLSAPGRSTEKPRRHFEKNAFIRTTMDTIRGAFKLTNGHLFSRGIVYLALMAGTKALIGTQTFSVLSPFILAYFAAELVASPLVYNHTKMFKKEALVTPLESPFKLKEWIAIIRGKKRINDNVDEIDGPEDLDNDGGDESNVVSDQNEASKWKNETTKKQWDDFYKNLERENADPSSHVDAYYKHIFKDLDGRKVH